MEKKRSNWGGVCLCCFKSTCELILVFIYSLPIQNVPIPLKFPAEYDSQLWGGEGVVQGFEKREEYNRRVPHFWVPHLKRTVIYSEVLDKYISVVVTNRALNLIHSNYGFDHYLLKVFATFNRLMQLTFNVLVSPDTSL